MSSRVPKSGNKVDVSQEHLQRTTQRATQRTLLGAIATSADLSPQFEDRRPQAVAQRAMQQIVDHSPRVTQFQAFQRMAQNPTRITQLASIAATTRDTSLQKNEVEEAPLKAKSQQAVTQRVASVVAPQPNNTGLPDSLKSGVESLSGMRMDHVKVHYNSAQPAQLNAHAYAQGSEIHLATGQERHLPHEAWHVVQQAQGRVKPTMQMKGGAPVNDDVALEREADVMGRKAMQMPQLANGAGVGAADELNAATPLAQPSQPVQLAIEEAVAAYAENHQRVTGIAGEGIILEVAGKGYTVAFDSGDTFYVPAAELDLVEEHEAVKEVFEKKSADHRDDAPTLTTASAVVAKDDSSNVPVKLVVIKGKGNNDWTVKLKNDKNEELVSVDGMKQGVLKTYMQKILEVKAEPKAGEFKIKVGAEIKGQLADSMKINSEKKKANAELEGLREKRVGSSALGATSVSQEALFDRLGKLQGAKKLVETGHPTISMTKIRLDKSIFLTVGGVPREITHLYTQVGNPTELRCYLGNDNGAYQRVHTSITVIKNQPMVAHTMVQIGDEISVPTAREKAGATRIGFDSTEETGKPGFANREFTIRSKEQCNVQGIAGANWGDMSEEQKRGCTLLATRFNLALDKVCLDIMTGKADERTVTGIGSGFKVLDDSWLFENKDKARPELELAHAEKEKK